MSTRANKKQKDKDKLVSNAVFQNKTNTKGNVQFEDNRPEAVAQRKLQEMADDSPQVKQIAQQQPIQKKANTTGLPDKLKTGIENLSGYSMDDVKVHYNSNKPAQLQAHAYAQGTNIHLASGQEKHLPHEAWHVVQQKQGRVKATTQMKGIGINTNTGLEKEADAMGQTALNTTVKGKALKNNSTSSNTVQAISYYKYIHDVPSYQGKYTADTSATIFRKENVDAERLKEFKNWVRDYYDIDVYKKGDDYFIEKDVNHLTAVRENDNMAEMRKIYKEVEKYSDDYVPEADKSDDDIRTWNNEDNVVDGVPRRKKEDFKTIKDKDGGDYLHINKTRKEDSEVNTEIYKHYYNIIKDTIKPQKKKEDKKDYKKRKEKAVRKHIKKQEHTLVDSKKTLAARKKFNNQGLLDKYLYNIWRKDTEAHIEEFPQSEINTPTDMSKVRNLYFRICRLAGIAMPWENAYYTNGHGYAHEPNAVKIARDMVFKNGQYKNGSYYVERYNANENKNTYHKVKNLSHCSYSFAQGAKFTVITKHQDPDSIIAIATHITNTSYSVSKVTGEAHGYLAVGDKIYYDRPNNAGKNIQEYSY